MTIRTADVVAPMFPAAEIIPFLFTGVAGEACFRDLFGALVFERNDLLWIAFGEVRFAWSMTRLTASYFSLPALDI